MAIIRLIASLKVTVSLLLVILVVLSVGTIIESLHGAEQARAVYYSTWFALLLGAFAVNLAASLIERWPWSRLRIGFVVTHGAMLVILAGALVTDAFKIDGQLGLWEGEASDQITVLTADGGQETVKLPFTVRLDAFEIDHYPGTMRPAMFRSRVTVIDPTAAAPLPAVIEMNRELHHGGFKFFQSSYRQAGGREATILSVSRDPGQTIVFVGYGLLVLGMCIVLLTRLLARSTREVAPAPVGGRGPGLPTLGIIVLAVFFAPALHAATDISEAVVDELRVLPVQFDGRVMPLDTMARDSVRDVTGKRRWHGEDPVATVLGWSIDPETAAAAALVKIGEADLAAELGIATSGRYASFNSLLANQRFMEITRNARLRASRDEALSPVDSAALELEGRLVTLRSFMTDQAILMIPVSTDPEARWMAPESVTSAAALAELGRSLRAQTHPLYPHAGAMQREVTYNRVRSPRLAWLILIPTVLLAGIAWQRDLKILDLPVAIGLLVGFSVMSWGIAMRWLVAGRIPASNMYESMLFLAWGVGLFALLAAMFSKNRLVIFNAAAMSTLTITLVDLLPMDPFIHPMPPVLSGTPWLAIHVPIIMVSYSVLALGVLVAHMRVGLPIFTRGKEAAARRMDELLYWYMHIGSILLIVGILTGSIWAASSWGRYWGWDPKEVWSLVAFLAYMAILHSRLDRVIGNFGVAVASIAAFWTVLMTYLGVNYVLAAGLHSYGFGGGKVVRWMLVFAVLEIAFLSYAAVAERRQRRSAA